MMMLRVCMQIKPWLAFLLASEGGFKTAKGGYYSLTRPLAYVMEPSMELKAPLCAPLFTASWRKKTATLTIDSDFAPIHFGRLATLAISTPTAPRRSAEKAAITDRRRDEPRDKRRQRTLFFFLCFFF